MHHCAIDDALHEKGRRKTHPRHRIIELFHQPRPWTASALQRELHDVGRATIFRTLRLLRDEGLIVSLHHHGNEESFERADQQHHDHFLCTECQTAECLPCPVPSLTSHVLELQGQCRACKK